MTKDIRTDALAYVIRNRNVLNSELSFAGVGDRKFQATLVSAEVTATKRQEKHTGTTNFRNFTTSPQRAATDLTSKSRKPKKDVGKVPTVNPELKGRSYWQPHLAKNDIHDFDREKARSLVHNLVFDPANPDIQQHPLLNRKKEVEPERDFDKQSLFLVGQSDRDILLTN